MKYTKEKLTKATRFFSTSFINMKTNMIDLEKFESYYVFLMENRNLLNSINGFNLYALELLKATVFLKNVDDNQRYKEIITSMSKLLLEEKSKKLIK